MLDLNLLRIFSVVFKHQSYTKAALELGTTQSAVSQSIKKLEQSLGYKLFIKQGRGITTTFRGTKLADEVEVGLNILDTSVEAKRELNIYSIEMVMHLIGIGEFDGIRVSTPSSNPEKNYLDIRTQKVDMVIDYFPTRDPSLVSEVILDESIVVVCRKNHPRLQGDALTLEQFQSEKHISLKARWAGQKLLDTVLPSAGFDRNDMVEVPSSTSGLMLVSESDMIMSCPRTLAQKWRDILSLHLIQLPFEAEPITVHLVYHKRFVNDPVHKQVRDEIKKRIAQEIDKHS
ncbi:LysR family transcriptional regulator [Vibrio sp. WXL103]|uniref:LysR family transcriptional regulator n=1 Tax=Vibrio sp. WXL103 TaxID=3450710 RepID=UPI003EC6F61F